MSPKPLLVAGLRHALLLSALAGAISSQQSQTALEKKVTVARAMTAVRKARLASIEAEETLRQTTALHARGFVAARELEADRRRHDGAAAALRVAERGLARARAGVGVASRPAALSTIADISARLESARDQVAAAQRDLARSEKLHAHGFIGDGELREGRDAVAAAQADVHAHEQRLDIYRRHQRGEIPRARVIVAERRLQLELAIADLERRSERAEHRLSRTHQLRAVDFVSAADLRRDEVALWNLRSELRVARLELELLGEAAGTDAKQKQ